MISGLSHRLKATRLSSVGRIALISFGIVVFTFQFCGFLSIRINTSPSLPLGFYIATSDPKANLVEFCPAEPFASISISRGYRDQGACDDGAAPLLKPVVAGPRDIVDFSPRGIEVNGRLLPKTAPLKADTKDRPLTPWTFGRYVVQRGNLWVASSYNPRSFDSRYFGPISTKSIREHLRPLLTAW
jgi:conjugative transfer signal peptidase TraF